MALSGSLSFVSASDWAIGNPGAGGYSGFTTYTMGAEGIDFMPAANFTHLNLGIYEPVTASTNQLGYPNLVFVRHNADRGFCNYSNISFVAENNTFFETYVTDPANPRHGLQSILNNVLLKRNGPYQHPMWKQYRTADHPVARTLRLNNTMSIDSAYADARERENEKKHLRYMLENGTHKDVKDYFELTNNQLKNSNTTNPQLYRNASLQQYYEPSVLSAHKPFIYDIGGDFKVRSTLMNQMVFFENKEIDHAMKIAGPDRYTSSFSGAPIQRPKQEYYDFITAAKENGAIRFIYSETIFPKSINTFRPYKLEKPSYEEENSAAVLANSFNSVNNRSFWRSLQPALARGIVPGTNNRNRGVREALNSQNILQTFNGPRKIRVEANLNLISDNGGLGDDSQQWQYTYNFMEPGIVLHSAVNTTTGAFNSTVGGPTGSFVVQEAYQPHPLTLLSMWPLDARPDLYSSPAYLTSSHGGFGAHIGLTPHRMFEFAPNTGRDASSLSYALTNSPVFTSSADTVRGSQVSVVGGHAFFNTSTGFQYHVHTTATGSTAQYVRLATGSAGELVYSTKPTMFFHKTGSETNDIAI